MSSFHQFTREETWCWGFRFGCHGSHCPRRQENRTVRDVGWQVHFKSDCIFSVLTNKQTNILRVTPMRERSLRMERSMLFLYSTEGRILSSERGYLKPVPVTDISGDFGWISVLFFIFLFRPYTLQSWGCIFLSGVHLDCKLASCWKKVQISPITSPAPYPGLRHEKIWLCWPQDSSNEAWEVLWYQP